MPNFIYFAYGSNMLTSRLVARCGSAKAVGTAYANGYKLVFSKQSIDGSGKGTLIPAEQAKTCGVLYEISKDEKEDLDRFEGTDYLCRSDFPVVSFDDAKAIATTTYIAKANAPGLVPFDWYAALILAGAKEHGLITRAPDILSELTWKGDADALRKTHVGALALLRARGIDDPHHYLTTHAASIKALAAEAKT